MELELNWIKSDVELNYNTYFFRIAVCTDVRREKQTNLAYNDVAKNRNARVESG